VRLRGKVWYIAFREPQLGPEGQLEYRKVERPIEGATSRRDAERKGYDQWVSKANAIARVPQGVATLAEFIELRFNPDHVAGLKPTGQQHYRMMLQHILPTLGTIKLADVSPQMVQILLNAKTKSGLSPQTVLHIKNALSAVFRHARFMRFYEGQLPTESVKTPAVVRKERHALTWPQVQLLADKIDPRYRPLVIVLAAGGLRIGEAMGLRWSHINLSDEWVVIDGEALPPNSLLVNSAWVRGARTTTKTRAGWRKIPLISDSWVALAMHFEAAERRGPDDPVFCSQAGTPFDQHNVAARYLKPAARALGLPWVSWHCLRHTCSTIADRVLTVAEKMRLLGHSDISMAAHYTHPDLERVRAAMERMTTKEIQ
jgi:integrase